MRFSHNTNRLICTYRYVYACKLRIIENNMYMRDDEKSPNWILPDIIKRTSILTQRTYILFLIHSILYAGA